MLEFIRLNLILAVVLAKYLSPIFSLIIRGWSLFLVDGLC